MKGLWYLGAVMVAVGALAQLTHPPGPMLAAVVGIGFMAIAHGAPRR